MRPLTELTDGWFLLTWWVLAIAGGWISGWIRRALEFPGSGRGETQVGHLTAYDVSFLSPGNSWAGYAAVCSMLHAGVVRVDEKGALQRGSEPLPDDAPLIERYVFERAAGMDVKSTLDVVVERARPHHRERLHARGLLVSKAVSVASRFVQGCVLAMIAAVALIWLRHNTIALFDLSLAAVVLVLSLTLFGLLSVLVLRGASHPTRLGRAVLRRLDTLVKLPESLAGWPAPDVPVSQIRFVVGVLGFSAFLRGACRRYRDAVIEGRPVADDEPGPRASVRFHEAVLEGGVGAATKGDIERADRLAYLMVGVAAVATAIALVWMVRTAGAMRVGYRATPTFLEDQPVFVPDAYGVRQRARPMPRVERGRRAAACDPEAAARVEKRNVFSVLAEEDRRRRESEGPQPPTAEARAHRGDPGMLYGATEDRLYRLSVGAGVVSAEEIGPLLVAVPVFGPERTLRENDYFAPRIDGLTFSRDGMLWATGDDRVYFCSVSTAICATQGIVPPDARAILFTEDPAGNEQLLASDASLSLQVLQLLSAPSFLGDVGAQLVGRMELCTEPGPESPRGLSVTVGPVRMPDGTAVAVVRGKAGAELAFVVLGEAPTIVERVPLPEALQPVAIVPNARGLLLVGVDGAIHQRTEDGVIQRLGETGRQWRAAAGFQLE